MPSGCGAERDGGEPSADVIAMYREVERKVDSMRAVSIAPSRCLSDGLSDRM